MKLEMKSAIPEVINDLAGGISSAADVQNAYWLALALFSIFIIVPTYLPKGTADDPTPRYQLPFNLPDLNPRWFVCISLILLCGLIVAFCAAQANLIRSETLARKVLKFE